MKSNIFQFVDGYLWPDELGETKSRAVYVTVNNVFRERDYANAVYINVIIILSWTEWMTLRVDTRVVVRRFSKPKTRNFPFQLRSTWWLAEKSIGFFGSFSIKGTMSIIKRVLLVISLIQGHSKTQSIETLYQKFIEKYEKKAATKTVNAIKLQNCAGDKEDEENINFDDADDHIDVKIQSLIAPVESIKNKILFSSHYEYEEVCDFAKLYRRNSTITTNSSIFDRIIPLSTQREQNNNGIGKKIFSEELER